MPATCPGTAAYDVCGCDGTIYDDECAAAMAGVDVAEASHCTPPKGQFGCGTFLCNAASQYCQVTKSDIAGEPDAYQCVLMPAACVTDVPPTGPECTCVATEPCGSMCTKETDGHLTVTCPGG